MHFVFLGQRGNLFQIPWRYLTQGYQTWRILIHEHPDIIFVQNPPIFSVLDAFIYDKLYKASMLSSPIQPPSFRQNDIGPLGYIVHYPVERQ